MILWQGHSCSHMFVPRGWAQLCAGCCFEAVGAGSSISRWLWLQHHPVMARCAFRGQEGCLPSLDMSCSCPARPTSREGSAFLSTPCLLLPHPRPGYQVFLLGSCWQPPVFIPAPIPAQCVPPGSRGPFPCKQSSVTQAKPWLFPEEIQSCLSHL